MRWRQFCAELLAAADELGGQIVVTLGALLADTPHTRPVPVSGTATEPELVDRLKLEQSTYEGPTGIVGVFQDACARLDIPAVSYWAAVPHYVAQPPCPKATLALLGRIEDLLEVSIPLGDLPEDARAWERGVDELAEEDEDIAEYVRALEETRDTTELPEASGEAIAREFERYLKRRGDEAPADEFRLRRGSAPPAGSSVDGGGGSRELTREGDGDPRPRAPSADSLRSRCRRARPCPLAPASVRRWLRRAPSDPSGAEWTATPRGSRCARSLRTVRPRVR